MKEEVFLLGSDRSLVSVITEPDSPPDPAMPAVVLFNAGLIHRVGPNRIYVKLARRLTDMGMVVVRFDLSGVGDSAVRTDQVSLQETVLSDARQVMDYLTQTRGSERFLLMGHCGGALISLGIASADPRTIGVVMINAEGGDTQWDAYDRKRKTSRYYENYYGRDALTNAGKWKKLLTGKAHYRSIARNIFQNILWNKVTAAGFKLRKSLRSNQAQATRPEVAALFSAIPALAERGTDVLIVYSKGSTGLERTRLLIRDVQKKLRGSSRFRLEIIPQSDHTFTLLDSQQRLFSTIEAWCQSTVGMPSEVPAP